MYRRCGRAFYRAAAPRTAPYARPKQKGEPPCDSPYLPGLPPRDYFLSVGWLNGKVPNMFLAWFCICSCICTNRFLLCSM